MNDDVQNTLLRLARGANKVADMVCVAAEVVADFADGFAAEVEREVAKARDKAVEEEEARAEAKRRHPAGSGLFTHNTEQDAAVDGAVGREDMLTYLKTNRPNTIWEDKDSTDKFSDEHIELCYVIAKEYDKIGFGSLIR